MFIGLPIAVLVAVLTWIFSPKLGIDMRGKISMTALSAGAVSAVTAGFMYNNIVGVCTIAACLFIVSVLFGYERN
jgi:hypothetical protein